MLAKLADKAYHPNTLDTNKWRLVQIIHIHAKNAQGFVVVSKTENIIVVAIRGTVVTSFKNLTTDLKFIKKGYHYCHGCQVHSGFYDQTNSMVSGLDKALEEALRIKPDADIIITGHSLGGAVATLYADHVLNRWPGKFQDRLSLVTFGSPRVGNKEFAAYSNRILKNIYRVVYKYDPVTQVPPTKLGFKHVGGDKYQFNSFSDFLKERFDVDGDSLNPLNYLKFGDHSQYKNIIKKALK
jgi:predicted lipase